jgi:hypothetical protein
MKPLEWTEVRLGEMFRIIANKTKAGWVFYEESIWEVRRFKISPDPELIAKAEKLSFEQLLRAKAA